MNYQVLTELKVKTAQGETTLSPGQMIELNASKADSFLAQGKIKQISMEDMVNDILSYTVSRLSKIYNGRQYHATAELKKAEDEIDRLTKSVLNGQASISLFQKACENWVFLCQTRLRLDSEN